MAQATRLPGITLARPVVRPLEGGEPGARAFVWGTWVLMALGATAFVAWYGSPIPVADDYNIVFPLIGVRPVSLEWLWEQCNEHRIAFPKLILLAADRLAGSDIRAGMFLSVATLAGLAAALIGLSARLSGGTRSSDALFPILLLHPGHATNLLWSIQLAFILPTALGTAFLIPIVGRPAWPGLRTAAMAGTLLGVLPLSGGTGLAFVPALALWLLVAAWAEAQSGRPGARRRAALIAMATIPGLTLSALYFRGFQPGIHPESEAWLLAGLRTGLQFLSGGLGRPAAQAWPMSGVATLGLVALALGFLGRAWLCRPQERPRIFGLLAFLAAMVSLAAAVGWGRGWAGDRAGFQDRYETMAVPLWCWLPFAFRLYAPAAIGRQIPNALFAVSCALAWPNTQAGLEHGRELAVNLNGLRRDLLAGMPTYQVVRHHTQQFNSNHDEVARLLPLLRSAGFGPFRYLRDNPPLVAVRLPVEPTELSLVRWDGHTAHVNGVDPQITFTLPSPRYVAGIRIRYSHHNPQKAPARFQLTWKHPGQLEYTSDQRYACWFQPTGEGRVTTVWVDDTVDQFRIQPDNQPCEFQIDEIVLLVPR